MDTNIIHTGDALTVLQQMPDEFVHCIVTSPPYYGLRDYGTDGQLGLEDTPQAYIAGMVAIFAEARRVLRDDGVLWLNMGDSYASGGLGNKKLGTRGEQGSTAAMGGINRPRSISVNGLKPKDLMLMPHRLAIALQDDGWYVRQDNVWHKPNPMPESVSDRTTRAHEYVFMLTKAARYWYDADAVREGIAPSTVTRWGDTPTRKNASPQGLAANGVTGEDTMGINPAGRNLRSVWTIATAPYADAHFATFPPALPELCIKAGCPDITCGVCGKGWVRVVAETKHTENRRANDKQYTGRGTLTPHSTPRGPNNNFGNVSRQTIGFAPACDCATDDTGRGIVLDPFMGSGTVAVVARDLGRDYVGIELNPEYVELAKLRLGQKSRIDHLNEQEPEPLQPISKGDLEIKPLWD